MIILAVFVPRGYKAVGWVLLPGSLDVSVDTSLGRLVPMSAVSVAMVGIRCDVSCKLLICAGFEVEDDGSDGWMVLVLAPYS